MPKTEPFDRYADEYDRWFEENREVYEAELGAVRALVPAGGEGLEIGVGTGRFAGPLGIGTGVEPSEEMAARARKLGVDVRIGVAESLPFADGFFDFVLMVTTICFLDDAAKAFREARRVLKPGGSIVVGFIDGESELGKKYDSRRNRSRFYGEARFRSAPEVAKLLEEAGFRVTAVKQTLFPGDAGHEIRDGSGEGAFVVVEGLK